MKNLITGFLLVLIVSFGCIAIWVTDYTITEKTVIAAASGLTALSYFISEYLEN